MFALGDFQRDLCGFKLGAVAFQLCFARVYFVDLGNVVNLGNQVALFHFVADFDVHFFDLPRYLRAHVYQIGGGNFAGCRHGLADFAAFHFFCEIGHFVFGLEMLVAEITAAANHGSGNQNFDHLLHGKNLVCSVWKDGMI